MSVEAEKNDAKAKTPQDPPAPAVMNVVIAELDKDTPANVHLTEKKLEGLAVGSVTTEAQADGSVGHDLNTAKEEKMPISSSNEDSATDTHLGSDDLKPDSTQEPQSQYLFRPPQTIFSSIRSTHQSRSYEQKESRKPPRRKFENKDDIRDIHDRSYRNILDPRAGTPERFMTITAQALYGYNPPSLEELRVSDYALSLIRPLSLGDTSKQLSTADTSHPFNDNKLVDRKPATSSQSSLPSITKKLASEQTAVPTSLRGVSSTPINPSPAIGREIDLETRSATGEV